MFEIVLDYYYYQKKKKKKKKKCKIECNAFLGLRYSH